ncbi:TadE family type IV pilus minor pilin [Peterkaempfera sp. SMS 1(5)a]|uniref:TadE family type IV pilus minor pilin n=1 Tax=Peterkaempfera podocarpi TaxID=3232308 RepID=UPI00366C2552
MWASERLPRLPCRLHGSRARSSASARPGRRNGRRGPEAGYATAETAVALPAIVLLCSMLLWGLLATAAQIRCVDAARIGARAAARGDGDAAAVAAAREAAPEGAEIRLERGARTVRVAVEVPFGGPGRLAGLLTVRLSAAAVAEREDVRVEEPTPPDGRQAALGGQP